MNEKIVAIQTELRSHKYYIFVYLLISLVPFFWLREGLQICSWDTGYGFFCPKIGNDLNIVKYVWDFSMSAGRPMTYYHPTFFTLSILYAILDRVSISPAIGQGILFSSIILTSLIFMYLLVLEVFRTNKERKNIGFFSSIFYVLNFGTLFWFFYNTVNFIYIIPATPLILYLLLRTFREHNFFYAFLFSSALSIFSIIFINIAFGILILVLCSLFYLVFNGFNKIKFAFLIIILFFLLNSFWILPAIGSYQYFITEASKLSSTKESFDVGSSNNILSTLVQIPTKNIWWINISATSWIDVYYSGLFRIISVFFVIIIFLSLFDKETTKVDTKTILFFSLLSLIGLFLAKGNKEPLGSIMQFIMTSEIIPFFPRIFAVSNQKFSIIIILSYSFLFGYGSNFVWRSINKYDKKVAIVIMSVILFSLFTFAFPFFNGQLVNSPITFGGANVSSNVKIPDDYIRIDEYLMKNNTDYRILSLPLFPYNMGTYNWKYGYLGEPLEKNTFHRSTFSIEFFRKTWDKGVELIINSINNDKRDLSKISGLLNIKYVILHHDIDINNGNYLGNNLIPPEYLSNILIKNKFNYIGSFGKLDLYEIPSNDFLPHIYSVDKYTITSDLNGMFDLVGQESFIPGDSIIIVEDKLNKGKINSLKEKEKPNSYKSGYHPQITFIKINPTKYQVEINATQPFFLVFSESFHPQWQAYIDNPFKCEQTAYYENTNVKECKQEDSFMPLDFSYLFAKPLPEEDHFTANGYANAWYIDPKDIGKQNFTITLYFLPQSYFYTGLIISGITFIFCIGYLYWKRKHEINRLSRCEALENRDEKV